jgi:hypothetical protein
MMGENELKKKVSYILMEEIEVVEKMPFVKIIEKLVVEIDNMNKFIERNL